MLDLPANAASEIAPLSFHTELDAVVELRVHTVLVVVPDTTSTDDTSDEPPV